MKKKQNFILSLVPVFATFMLVLNINSTASWLKGQNEPPETAKKYRKF